MFLNFENLQFVTSINDSGLKLNIKYMVSPRCQMVVKKELKRHGLHFIFPDLGVVDIMENLTEDQHKQIRIELLKSGLELMDDRKSVLIEKIKRVITDMLQNKDGLPKINISDYLSEELKYDYSYLANLFSEVQGTTIEKYLISYKIEKVKELIIYNHLSLSEIAWKMNYSSVGHLSNQFKKNTGLSPTHFKNLSVIRQKTIEDT